MLQHLTSGVPHLLGRLSYGNDELFDRFGRAIAGDLEALAPIDGAAALATLSLQHDIIEQADGIYA